MSNGRTNDLYKQLEEAFKKIDNLNNTISEMKVAHAKEIKSLTKEISNLKNENKRLKITIEKKDKEIVKLKSQLLQEKTKNKKDSTNSSKPSSTNGYKNVVTNTRKKTGNKPGKPKGTKSTNLSNEKLQNFINSGDVEFKTIEVGKNKLNQHKKPIIRKVIDIKIIKRLITYKYYPDKNGKYNIPEYQNNAIVYGNNIKAFCVTLNNAIYNSTDAIASFLSCITNNGINIAKSTILEWNNILSTKLELEINNIEEELLKSYYLNCDDSTIKINAMSYYDLCVCNKQYTRLWISNSKSHEAWEKISILSDYNGIIVKDGTNVFNDLGIFYAQCISHINRYCKGIYDFVDHQGPKLMEEFLQKCIHNRKEAIDKGKTSYTDEELKSIYNEYNVIVSNWKKEWMNSKSSENAVYNDERRLLNRFEDEEERNQILFFVKDFKVPTTNSQAEVDQRGGKIKQKIGKFRSINGATNYANIKSCILTYKKHKLNVFDCLYKAFNNQTVII